MKPLKRISITFALLLTLVSLTFGGAVSVSKAQSFQQPILVVNTSFLNVRTGPGVQYTVLVTVVGGTELPVLGTFSDGVWYQVNTDGGPGWVNIEFTLPRGDFSNLPLLAVGETGAPNVNLGQGGGFAAPTTSVAAAGQRIQGVSLIGRDLRAQPDYESLILSRNIPNDPTTIYPLINATTGVDGTTWYLVNVPGTGAGWMDGVILRVLGCTTETVATIQYDTELRFDGIANRDPFLIPSGTEGYVGAFSGANNEFVTFELADGTVGIVSYAATAPRAGVTSVCDGVPTAAANLGQGGGAAATTAGTRTTVPVLAGNRVVINTGFLNLRSGPAASYSVIATVSGGDELIVLGRATDNVWFLVEGVFGQAWLNSQFTLFRGDYSTVPVITEPVILDTTASLGQGGGSATQTASVVTGRSVTGVSLVGKDLHEGPSYETLILSRNVPNDPTTVYPLLAAEVAADGSTWYLVDIPNVGRGWMDNVDFRVLQCGNDSVGISSAIVPITFDGFSAQEPYLLPLGTEFYIVGRRNDQAIIELLDGSVGYLDANAVIQRTGIVSVCTGVTSTVSAQTPTAGTSTVTTGAPIPQVTGNRVVINTGNLNVRSGPNAAFSTVATVPGGSELAVIGRATDGVWYFVEGSFGQGWINSEFVLFRGDFGTVPVINITGN